MAKITEMRISHVWCDGAHADHAYQYVDIQIENSLTLDSEIFIRYCIYVKRGPNHFCTVALKNERKVNTVLSHW
jgi:hypothetical protein